MINSFILLYLYKLPKLNDLKVCFIAYANMCFKNSILVKLLLDLKPIILLLVSKIQNCLNSYIICQLYL